MSNPATFIRTVLVRVRLGRGGYTAAAQVGDRKVTSSCRHSWCSPAEAVARAVYPVGEKTRDGYLILGHRPAHRRRPLDEREWHQVSIDLELQEVA